MSKTKVVLAYGREVDGKPRSAGETVSVDADVARQFIREGVAAPATVTPSEKKES
jgi:hypothetical protein